MVELALAWLATFGEPFPDIPEPAPQMSGSFSQAPVPHWNRRLPGTRVASASHTEHSAPATDGEHLYIGYASRAELFQLDRGGGSVTHRYPAAAPVQSPAVPLDDGVLFSDAAGYTWRYGQDALSERWSHYGGAPIAARPTVYDDVVYVANVDDVVYALDLDSGELLWRFARPPDPSRESELTLYGAPPPVVVDDLLLLGFSDGALLALDRGTGEQQWERRVGEGRYPDLIGEPVVDGGDVFIAGFSEPLVSLDLDTRNVRWRLDVGGAAAPLVDGPLVYHGGTDGKLRAIDRLTGAIIWEWDSETTGALTRPEAVAGGLLVASSDGGLYLIDAGSGKLTWEYEPLHLLDGFSANPLVIDRQLVVITNAGQLISLISPRDNPSPPYAMPVDAPL